MIQQIFKELKNPVQLSGKLLKRCSNKLEKHNYFFPQQTIDCDLEVSNYYSVRKNDQNIARELLKYEHITFLPNHGNMGDIVIAQAEYQFFDKHKLNYHIYNGILTENLVYGGGGLFVSNWKEDYQSILKVFKNPKIKNILLLPSSFFDCPDLLAVIDERFVIFCREKQSYEYLARSGVKATLLLENDMVFYLTQDFMKGKNKQRFSYKKIYHRVIPLVSNLVQKNGYKIAYFLRSDSESKTEWQKLGIHQTLDLSLCICSDCRNTEECNFYSKLFFTGIDTADIVVTDRLHIGICAALLGKEVFLVDNSYRKVSGVYENSMKNMLHVHFIDNVYSLSDEVNKIILSGAVPHTANINNITRIGKLLS
jgi:exopolysaccharide biosynthesis predicted pyruvyltransferase EpsI